MVVSVDVFVVVADGNHSGHDLDHGYDHDLPRLWRDCRVPTTVVSHAIDDRVASGT